MITFQYDMVYISYNIHNVLSLFNVDYGSNLNKYFKEYFFINLRVMEASVDDECVIKVQLLKCIKLIQCNWHMFYFMFESNLGHF